MTSNSQDNNDTFSLPAAKCSGNSRFLPIQTAAMQMDFDLVKLLLQEGTDLLAENKDGVTGLQTFYQLGEIELLKIIADYHPDLSKPEFCKLICYAVNSGKISTLEWMVTNGMPVPSTSGPKYDFLRLVIYQKNIAMLDWFLDHGYQINQPWRISVDDGFRLIPNMDGSDILQKAQSNLPIFIHLLKRGAVVTLEYIKQLIEDAREVDNMYTSERFLAGLCNDSLNASSYKSRYPFVVVAMIFARRSILRLIPECAKNEVIRCIQLILLRKCTLSELNEERRRLLTFHLTAETPEYMEIVTKNGLL